MGSACECQRVTTVQAEDPLTNLYTTGAAPETCDKPDNSQMATNVGPGSNTSTSVPQLIADDLDSDQDNETDVVDDLPQPSEAYMAVAKFRPSVSAEAYGEWNKRKHFVAPIYPKTAEQKARISHVLENNFLFSALAPEDVQTIINAFQEVSVEKGAVILRQGDDGDRLYLIESGQVQVYKRKQQQLQQPKFQQRELQPLQPECYVPGADEKLVTVMKPGDVFGELALMYNSPRAATVVAAEDMQLWALDRDSFTNIVRDASVKKREQFEKVLKEVPLFRDMDPYERSKLSDAMKTAHFAANEVIIKEGEKGDTFFILLAGEAAAYRNQQKVFHYKKGTFFGELALLTDQPRAATVTAVTDCLVAYFDRKSFKRLLGPLEQILSRSKDNYRTAMEALGLDTKYLDS